MRHESSSLESAVHVRTGTELKTAVDNAPPDKSVVIALDKDITLTETLTIPNNKDITLTSNKKAGFFKLIGARHENTIVVYNGGVLRLDGIAVTHANDGGIGSGVIVNVDGTLIMTSGEISGNKAYAGGGVRNNGNFTMLGGKIWGNYVYTYPSSRGSGGGGLGGGVVNSGTFTMSGGTISGNTARIGGGVYNWGTFKISGGIISGNRANTGSGVYNMSGTFNWRGGIIFGNIGYFINMWIIVILVYIVVGYHLMLYLKKKIKTRKGSTFSVDGHR
ncbi:MAG: hypothetical protein LBC03_02880 [Nitrososphaerota archaeon]|nr:hypothetical protein [Nitrososphaerota archaeon]